jgi:hypothetical protein
MTLPATNNITFPAAVMGQLLQIRALDTEPL